MPDLGALLTAIVTPFAEPTGHGDLRPRVDEDAFARLHKLVIERGADGVVACGTTGEASTLTDDEHLRVIELAVQNRPEGTTVVAGTGSNDTAHAVHLTERATELGADAILSVAPYYNRPNSRGILRHFEEISRATDKPIILYNIPNRSGIDMPNDLLAQLAQLPQVCGVKQANNDNLALVDGLDLYAGNDEILAKTMDIGGKGGICTASHIAGVQMKRLIDEPGEREAIDAELQPLFAALSVAPACSSIKAALSMQGFGPDIVRLPMVPADEYERQVIRTGLDRVGLLNQEASA